MLNYTLTSVEVYKAVCETMSFSEAAKSVNISPSRVSQIISELEKALGVSLVRRNTRKISLTDAGELFFKRSQELITLAEDMSHEVKEAKSEPDGKIRIATPYSPHFLYKILADFNTIYPKICIEIVEGNSYTDLIQEGVDIAIRTGHLPDSTYIMQPLGEISVYLYSTKEYLEEKGIPKTPEDLKQLDWIAHDAIHKFDYFDLINVSEATQRIKMRPSFRVTTLDSLMHFILLNKGFGVIPEFYVQNYNHPEKFVKICEDIFYLKTPIQAIYNNKNYLPLSVRKLIQFLKENKKIMLKE